MSHSRWNLLPSAPSRYLDSVLGFSPLIAQVLYNRGLTDSSQIASFLSTDESLAGDPFLLPDIHQAVARLYQALLRGEDIAVYGDFDADGITATALMIQGLTTLGARVVPYIPHRLTEGYGLNVTALENLQRQGISLVITVDCGITAFDQVKRANRLGLDVIITDHHTPLDTMPPATAIIDPKRTDSNYPFSELTGAGVALKLLQALFRSIGKGETLNELFDLVAIGTIADIAPIIGENRYLVKQGLRLINTNLRLGVREMISRTGWLNTSPLDTESISWVIAPRLNAAGRLAHAMTSYQLLTTHSVPEAQQLAAYLEQQNAERQRLTTQVLNNAREQVLPQASLPLLVASDKEYPVGIAGLAASRLCEEFYRPSVVIKTGEQVSSGSCRSIPEFNIIAALNQCRHLLIQFGGHSQAAGFSLPTKNLIRFKEYLSELAAVQLVDVDLRPRLDIDTEAALSELAGDTFNAIQQLAPFGHGNPQPTFISRRVVVADCRTMGSNGEHLRMKLKQDGTIWDAVAFGMGKAQPETSSFLDVVYNLEIDRWGREARLRLNLLDFAKAE